MPTNAHFNIIAEPFVSFQGEIIVKIVLIETDKYFCYAVASMHGQIAKTLHDLKPKRRRRNRWITDAIFCEDVLMFIVTNSARSIMIYEASG
ncbi:hypothetical protein NQ317_012651 [Molorchus minor]|uniref:Uncharacterized protein n=1 Tax=Molorchus minor TaxID=1323400 RepID=A0ABQ9J1G5_9CUCU|nr:hypothetical protein NQ317_012651 [Molorchus minor]